MISTEKNKHTFIQHILSDIHPSSWRTTQTILRVDLFSQNSATPKILSPKQWNYKVLQQKLFKDYLPSISPCITFHGKYTSHKTRSYITSHCAWPSYELSSLFHHSSYFISVVNLFDRSSPPLIVLDAL